MARYGLILIWLVVTMTAYGQNIRVNTLRSVSGIINEGSLAQSDVATFASDVTINHGGTLHAYGIDLQTGFSSMVITQSVSAAATAIKVGWVASGVAVGRGYVVIEPFSTNCEIREVASVSGTTINIIGAASYPLLFAHGVGTSVMWIPGGQGVPWTWFGGKPNDASAAGANVTGFNRASSNLYNLTLRGPGTIRIPAGGWYINNQLKPERDINIIGESPLLSIIYAHDDFPFTASGEVAMIHPQRDADPVVYATPGASVRVHLKGFQVNGRNLTNSCGILVSPNQPDEAHWVRVDNCMGLYAWAVVDCQQYVMRNCEMVHNAVGLRYRSAQMVYQYDLNIEQALVADFIAEEQPSGGGSCFNNSFKDTHLEHSQFASVSRARSANVATIVTAIDHGLPPGQRISVTGLGGAGYNLTDVAITVVNGTTFTYASAGGNEGTTSDTAGVLRPHIPKHWDIGSGDGWKFDGMEVANIADAPETLLHFNVTNGVSGHSQFMLENILCNQPSANFKIINDASRGNLSRTVSQVARRIQLLISGIDTTDNWAMEISGQNMGFNGGVNTPVQFGPGIRLGSSSNGPSVRFGNGSPEGNVTESRGSIWIDTNGGAGITAYIKESGVATSTGWVGVGPAASVILAPATGTRNTIQPTADALPLLIKGFSGGAQPVLELRKADDSPLLYMSQAGNGRLGVGKTPSYPLDVNGSINVGGITINDGTVVTAILMGSATLDFDLSAAAFHDLTITVTGAALENVVTLGVPHGSTGAEWDFPTAWVSAANTVTVRARTISGMPNPASGTFKVMVTKW